MPKPAKLAAKKAARILPYVAIAAAIGFGVWRYGVKAEAETLATYILWWYIATGTLAGVGHLRYVRRLKRIRQENPVAFYLHAIERDLGSRMARPD